MAEVCLGLALLALTAYAVLAGADLGSGFWDLTAGGDKRGGRVRGMVQRSMFPVFFGSIMSTLYIPLFGAALGIIFRGTAFAVRGQASTMAEARTFGAVFAAIASGRVPVGNAVGDPIDSWVNPTSILIGVLAVVSCAYISAVYLA